jgi:transcriptional antiterminator RfaH
MSYWACAQIEIQREKLAQQFLKLAGYDVYIPRICEQRQRRNRRFEVISPLFPTYAFVVIEQQWHTARRSIGVIGLIMDGVVPARVPDHIIQGLRKREHRGVIKLPAAPKIHVGDPVRVLGGPLAGQLGLYAGMKPHQRVEILLMLLGSQQRVTLPRDSVELAHALNLKRPLR